MLYSLPVPDDLAIFLPSRRSLCERMMVGVWCLEVKRMIASSFRSSERLPWLLLHAVEPFQRHHPELVVFVTCSY